MNRPPEDFLRAELHQALAAHQPDRTAMLNRIAANRAEQTRPRGRVLRLAGAALAVTTVLGLGGVARWALAGDEAPAPAPAAPPPATAPASSSSPSAPAAPTSTPPTSRAPKTTAPARTTTPPTPTPTPSAGRIRGLPGDTQVEKGSLRSESSTDGRASTVTLRPGADLTELDLVIRVVDRDGLSPDGTTNDAPDAAVTATTERQGDALLHRFTLRTGATLPAGTYRFTARHKGTTGNAAGNTYEAYAFSVERKLIHIYGNFAPH